MVNAFFLIIPVIRHVSEEKIFPGSATHVRISGRRPPTPCSIRSSSGYARRSSSISRRPPVPIASRLVIWGCYTMVTEKTAHLLMLKVREAMESSGNHPMDGTVYVDEFVPGGFEKGKIGRSYDTIKKKAVTVV